MELLIGLDLGTTNIKGVLISATGNILAKEKLETKLFYPQPGYVEFSVKTQYKLVCQLIKTLVKNVTYKSQIKAISISAASGNTLLMDKNKEPLYQVISWMDERVKQSQEELFSNLNEKIIYKIVGWPYVKMFPLAHLFWLKKYKTSYYKQASYYGMDINYLLYRLCGVFALDFSMATTFYLQEQVKYNWYKPFLNILEIEEKSLPVLLPSGKSIGMLTKQATEETGLSSGTKVVLGAFDHPSAARGVGVLEIGSLLLSCGTSWVGFFPIANRESAFLSNLAVDPFLSPDGPWGAIFSLPCLGRTIDSYIKHLFGSKNSISYNYQKFNMESAEAIIGANGLFIDLTKPELIEQNILSLLKQYSYQEICRAIMENAAYELKAKIVSLGIQVEKVIMVGGITESFIWPQILADITGFKIKLLKDQNGQIAGAIGAAILAAIGADICCSAKEGIKKFNLQFKLITPNLANTEKYEKLYQQYLLRK